MSLRVFFHSNRHFECQHDCPKRIPTDRSILCPLRTIFVNINDTAPENIDLGTKMLPVTLFLIIKYDAGDIYTEHVQRRITKMDPCIALLNQTR